jgi:hypothetical protein
MCVKASRGTWRRWIVWGHVGMDNLSNKKVLVMERIDGVPIAENWPLELRDEVCIYQWQYSFDPTEEAAASILNPCLRELFPLPVIQTDPNWTNFLYNTKAGKTYLCSQRLTNDRFNWSLLEHRESIWRRLSTTGWDYYNMESSEIEIGAFVIGWNWVILQGTKARSGPF